MAYLVDLCALSLDARMEFASLQTYVVAILVGQAKIALWIADAISIVNAPSLVRELAIDVKTTQLEVGANLVLLAISEPAQRRV